MKRSQNKGTNYLPKVLFIGQLPPPVHGVSLMNNYVVNSTVLKQHFHIRVISPRFITVLTQSTKFSIEKIFKVPVYGYKIIKKIIAEKPDLVYFTFVPTGFAFYRDSFYVLILKLFQLKIILHLHGKGVEENISSSIIKKYFYRWVFKNTYIICLSRKLSEDIKDVYKLDPYIVPNGIKVQSYFDRNFQSSKSVLQILYLSHYKRSKGILELIEALKILKMQGYSFVARLVGEPLDLSIETLERIVYEYNLSEQIEIVGPLYGDDKLNELKRSDIFVFPTYYEAFGLVILEAMQYSLPIISTCEGSIPDIVVNNETGFMVEKQKPIMLAEKIALLLTNGELRKRMGKKGYERFKNNFTLQHFESNLYRTFQKILNTSRAV